jgi:hypothetical protein
VEDQPLVGQYVASAAMTTSSSRMEMAFIWVTTAVPQDGFRDLGDDLQSPG